MRIIPYLGYNCLMRLDRLLANSGYGTRSEIRILVRSHKVSVDGLVVSDPGASVNENSNISILGQDVITKNKLYFVFDKPDGVLTAMEDKRLQTIADFIPQTLNTKGLSPVGRLDYHTTGLLIITNDGELSHRLTSPKFNVPKTYLVDYDGDELSQEQIDIVSKGMTLSDKPNERIKLQPTKLVLIRPGKCLLILTEGKTHQVRRMIASFNRSVTKLARISIGPISLSGFEETLFSSKNEGIKDADIFDKLPTGTGELVELTPEQISALLRSVGFDSI